MLRRRLTNILLCTALQVSVFSNIISAQNNVTFQVRMNIKMLEGTFQPQGGDRVAVAGDFNGWSTLPDTLRDPEGDSVYAATRSLPTGPITYKFWKTLRGGIDWEGDPNRTYTVVFGNQVLPPVYFDRDSVNNAPVNVPVTFRVNMRVKILEGTFQPNSGDIVRVLGTFNNWGTTPDTLVHEPAPLDSIYRKTTLLPESTTIEFKYWKTIRGGIGFESGPNRVYTVPRGGGIVPLVYFDNDSIIGVPITANIVWRVNMRAFQNIGWFDQSVDSVQVRLQIMGWNGIRMLFDSLSQLYRVVIPYSGIGFDDLAYKYYIKFDSATAVARFPGWQDVLLRDAMQFEHPYALGDGVRIFNVQNGGNISTPPYYYSDIHPYWTMNSTADTVRVTLRVNMGPATRYIDPFNPSMDTLKVVWKDALWHAAQIANQGTFPREIRMTRQSPTDSVWWATFRVKGKAHFGMMYVYKYVHPAGGAVEEGGGLGIQKPFRVRLLPLLAPNTFPPSYTAPIDLWQRNPPMPGEELPPIGMDVKEIFGNELPSRFTLFQSYPNPFNPSTQIRYSLPLRARASLKVFDVLGQLVAILVDEEQMPGHYVAVLEGANFSTGLYFYRLEAGSFVDTKKTLLIK